MSAEWSQSNSDRVTETWKTLADTYGPRFLRDYGEKAPTVWDSAIRSLTTAQIQRGIRRLCAAGSSHPPTLPQFVKACREVGEVDGDPRPQPYLPAPRVEIDRFCRVGNVTLSRHILKACGEVPRELMDQLQSAKEKLTKDFREMSGELDVSDEQMQEDFHRAFSHVVAVGQERQDSSFARIA